jgi:hypothetical protein
MPPVAECFAPGPPLNPTFDVLIIRLFYTEKTEDWMIEDLKKLPNNLPLYHHSYLNHQSPARFLHRTALKFI